MNKEATHLNNDQLPVFYPNSVMEEYEKFSMEAQRMGIQFRYPEAFRRAFLDIGLAISQHEITLQQGWDIALKHYGHGIPSPDAENLGLLP